MPRCSRMIPPRSAPTACSACSGRADRVRSTWRSGRVAAGWPSRSCGPGRRTTRRPGGGSPLSCSPRDGCPGRAPRWCSTPTCRARRRTSSASTSTGRRCRRPSTTRVRVPLPPLVPPQAPPPVPPLVPPGGGGRGIGSQGAGPQGSGLQSRPSTPPCSALRTGSGCATTAGVAAPSWRGARCCGPPCTPATLSASPTLHSACSATRPWSPGRPRRPTSLRTRSMRGTDPFPHCRTCHSPSVTASSWRSWARPARASPHCSGLFSGNYPSPAARCCSAAWTWSPTANRSVTCSATCPSRTTCTNRSPSGRTCATPPGSGCPPICPGRSVRRASWRSSTGSASPSASTCGPRDSPAASSNGCPSPWRSCPTRCSCCWTSPPPASTPAWTRRSCVC